MERQAAGSRQQASAPQKRPNTEAKENQCTAKETSCRSGRQAASSKQQAATASSKQQVACCAPLPNHGLSQIVPARTLATEVVERGEDGLGDDLVFDQVRQEARRIIRSLGHINACKVKQPLSTQPTTARCASPSTESKRLHVATPCGRTGVAN